MPADAALLAEIPFFHFLDDDERVSLAARLEEERFDAGHMICHYGDPGDCLYVIRGGKAEVFFKDDTGSRIVLEVAGPGDGGGELSLAVGGPRAASVGVTECVEGRRLARAVLHFLPPAPPARALRPSDVL